MSVSLKQSYDIEYVSTENCARMDLFIDSAADLSSLTHFDSVKLLQGSTAEDISTGDLYTMKSDGTWVQQPAGITLDLTGYYTAAETDTLLAGKQDSLDASQLDAVNSGITSALVAMIQKTPQIKERSINTITGANTLDDTGISYTIAANEYVRITASARYSASGTNPDEIKIGTDSSVFAHEQIVTGDNQYSLSASCVVGGFGSATTAKVFAKFRNAGSAIIVLLVESLPNV